MALLQKDSPWWMVQHPSLLQKSFLLHIFLVLFLIQVETFSCFHEVSGIFRPVVMLDCWLPYFCGVIISTEKTQELNQNLLMCCHFLYYSWIKVVHMQLILAWGHDSCQEIWAFCVVFFVHTWHTVYHSRSNHFLLLFRFACHCVKEFSRKKQHSRFN